MENFGFYSVETLILQGLFHYSDFELLGYFKTLLALFAILGVLH